MRMMLRCYLDIDAGNRAFKDGSLAVIIKKLMEKLKPEAAYFYPDKGQRSCLMIFDLVNTSDLPMILEPLFIELKAKIDLLPVMSAEDLENGLMQLQST
jgi:hypothetical protein